MIRYPNYKYILAFLDYAAILFSFFITQIIVDLIHKGDIILNLQFSPLSYMAYTLSSWLFIFIFQSNNLYKVNVFLTRAAHFAMVIKSVFLSVLIILTISFFVRFTITDSRLYILILTSVLISFLFIFRILLFRNFFLAFTKEEQFFSRNVVIIGAGKAGKILAAKLLFENKIGIKILGFIDDKIPQGEKIISGIKVIGKVNQLPFLNLDYNVDEIIIAIDHITYEHLLEIVDLCNNLKIPVKLTSELFDIIPQKIVLESYSGVPLINASPQLNNQFNMFIKRGVDVFGALTGLLLLLPVFLLLGVIIKITSKGPVLFSQIRVGKNGKVFRFYKFRSMAVSGNEDIERKDKMIEFMKNGNSGNKIVSKIVNEARITKIGKLIRKLSLDELPQLLNVLQGNMSLVGPRPCLPYEYEHYDEWQKRRTSVLPGCTGVWQVTGRSKVSFDDSIVLDLYYIKNMTPWLDLQIILKTLPVMIMAKGGK